MDLTVALFFRVAVDFCRDVFVFTFVFVVFAGRAGAALAEILLEVGLVFALAFALSFGAAAFEFLEAV